MKYRVLLILLLLTGYPALGQSAQILPGDSLIIHGIHQLYNFDHQEAIEIFREVIAQYPEHPAGHVLLGVARWEYTRGTVGIIASDDTLLRGMNRSAGIAKNYVKAHPKDPYGWLLYGMALGIQARVDLGRSHWVSAAIHGYKGIRKIKHAQNLAPDLPDLQIALGAFHYYVALAGPLLKVAAGIIGLSGNQEQGKTELRYAARHGRYVSPEAKNILTYIYGYLEDSLSVALTFSDTMSQEFPGSPYNWAIRSDLEYAAGDTITGSISLRHVQQLIPSLNRYYKEEYHKKNIYLEGVKAYHSQNYQHSIQLLQKYLEFHFEEYDLFQDSAELLLGKNYRALNENNNASAWFKKVLKRDIPTRMQREARLRLDEMKE